MIYLFLVFLIFTLLLFYMGWVEPQAYQINRYHRKIRKKLPRPLKILHLSDIHFSSPNSRLARFLKNLAKDDYDFVFISGDIMDCGSGIPFCEEQLKNFKPEFGMFAVYGNHDHYDYDFLNAIFNNFATKGKHPPIAQPIDELEKALNRIGVKVLQNETFPIDFAGETLLIHGLDDPTTGHSDAARVRPSVKPERVNLLLTHSVDSILEFEEGSIDATFSGHSHGGQLKFPIIGAPVSHTTLGQKFISGVQDYKGTHCSISRGVSSGRHFFFRLGSPTEAIVLTLEGC